MKYFIKTNAKINIGLNVIKKNSETGYHTLDMTMVPIDLSDSLKIETFEDQGDMILSTNKKDIPIDKKNIVCKIQEMFYNISKLQRKKMNIYLEKNIPHEAGLGGGSSDGGAMLRFLNDINDSFFKEEELMEIGVKIGADIPFFLINKPCRATGIGEELTPISNKLSSKIVIVKPNFGVSTKVAYENMDKLKDKKDADIDSIIDGMKKGDIQKVERSIENQLEQALLLNDSNIIEFRKQLDRIKDYKFFMSGSGSAYFTFVDRNTSQDDIMPLKEKLNNCKVYLCNFL